MTKRSFFFYGIYEGNEGEDTWKVLHEHFEKLSREDDARAATLESTDKKASKRK